MKFFISGGGVIRALDAEPKKLKALGRTQTVRGGLVDYSDELDGWTVKFPDGSALPDVFDTRAAAVAAEVAELSRRERARACPRPWSPVDRRTWEWYEAANISDGGE
jgi:hypothetical protein